jgi:hypothetical protein
MPTAIALFFVAIVALLSATYLPAQEARSELVVANAGATSFLAYREAVIDYLNANATFTGTVPDASLTFPWGYVRDTRWTNLVLSGGALYVYETAANSPNTDQVLDQLYRKTLSSFMVGRNSGGALVSANGFATGVAVPVSVPNGALLIVGK